MEKFAFIIHPLSVQDMSHVSPVLKFIPNNWLESALKLKNLFRCRISQASKALMPRQRAGLLAARLPQSRWWSCRKNLLWTGSSSQAGLLRSWALKS